MSCSRREFIAGLSLAAAAAILESPFKAMAQAVMAADNRYLIVGSGASLCAVNLKSRVVRKVHTGFLVHGFAQNPLKPERVWAIEKWGDAAVEIDFRQMKETHRLTAPAEKAFFGHGFFGSQGDALYLVQTDFTTGLGHLIGYDVNNFTPIKDYQVTPGALHDCRELADRTFLVVSHGSTLTMGPDQKRTYRPMIENSSLVHFDPRQNRVLDKKFIEDKDQILAHFAVGKNGTIIAIGLPRPESDPTTPDPLSSASYPSKGGGAVYIGALDKPSLRRIMLPPAVESRLLSEVLSVAIDDAAHTAIVTNPASKTIMFIDTNEGKFLGHLVTDAFGVSYDAERSDFIISGLKLSTVTADMKDPQPYPVKTMDGKDYTDNFSGAHSVILEMNNI